MQEIEFREYNAILNNRLDCLKKINDEFDAAFERFYHFKTERDKEDLFFILDDMFKITLRVIVDIDNIKNFLRKNDL